MSEEKIRTRHPEGKKGVNILARRYHQIKDYMLEKLSEKGELSYKALDEMANRDLSGKFDGRISWYVISVKLDLEARQVIERIPGSSPQMIRLKNK